MTLRVPRNLAPRTLAAIDDPYVDHPTSFAVAQSAGYWRGYLLRARDGDTFVCVLDRGFDQSTRHAVRIADYYAPELSQPEGFRYRVALEAFIGAPILVRPRRRTDGGEAFTFDRLVADTWLAMRTVDPLPIVFALRNILGPEAGKR